MKASRTAPTCIILAVHLLTNPLHAAEVLKLKDFVLQVEQNHGGLKASSAAAQAATQKASESEMLLAPTLYGSAQMASDHKESALSPIPVDHTDVSSGTLGISKATTFGLSIKTYYTASHTQLYGVDPQRLPDPSFYDAAPTLELSQSLWKNRWGKDVRTTLEMSETQAKQVGFIQAFKRKMILTEAESAYWRLSLAREALGLQNENLDRAKKLVAWTKGKVNDLLADDAEFLQAEALLRVRTLELKSATDEEKAAARSFNSSRGKEGAEVRETLEELTKERILGTTIPTAAGVREDYLATQESVKITELSAKAATEKYTPTVDLFASASLNGHDKEFSKTTSESFTSDHPTTAVGLKFSIPLGGDDLSHLREGLKNEHLAAKLQSERQGFEIAREFEDLTAKVREQQERLQLMVELVEVQKKKLQAERQRQQTGRSTTFQVLTYESDFVTAQINLIRAKAEVAATLSRLKLYGERS